MESPQTVRGHDPPVQSASTEPLVVLGDAALYDLYPTGLFGSRQWLGGLLTAVSGSGGCWSLLPLVRRVVERRGEKLDGTEAAGTHRGDLREPW